MLLKIKKTVLGSSLKLPADKWAPNSSSNFDQTSAECACSLFQRLVAEKESKLADMDAASTGEAARLRAAIESIKGELAHVKNEHV